MTVKEKMNTVADELYNIGIVPVIKLENVEKRRKACFGSS